MSTWKVFADAGNNFRWECADTKLSKEPQEAPIERPSSPQHLPCIADLFLQGYFKLCEVKDDKVETPPPTFRNGMGKPVAAKPSSMRKASAILGDDNTGFSDLSEVKSETPPTFWTGLGKSVPVKQSSLVKASSILRGQDDGALAEKGHLNRCEDKSDKVDTPPTFRTGSGKSVIVKQSSLAKALSIFGGQDDDALEDTGHLNRCEDNNAKVDTPPTFRTGLGKSVIVKQSSLAKALSILGGQDDDALEDTGEMIEGDNGTRCSNSMFQTGSGKAVNISSKGLVKARTLLGLEENSNHEDGGFDQSRKQENARVSFSCQTPSHPQMASSETTLGYVEAMNIPLSRTKFQSGVYSSEIEKVIWGSVHSATKPPPLKFQTAGGRSVKVSGDALKRARSLLGDPELGNFFNEGEPGSLVVSSKKDRIFDDNLLNKENDLGTNFSNESPKTKQMSNNFISPIRPTSFDKKFACGGTNLIKEFDGVECDTTHKQHDDVPCLQNSLTNRPHEIVGVRGASFKNGTASKVNSAKRTSNGPLVDISNIIGMNSTEDGQVMGEKRKPSSTACPSPFKKPRNSKFVTPFNKKPTLIPNGTLSKAPEESCNRRRVSSRYPFQVPRKYFKEYFVVPPSARNLSQHLPVWLRKMNPEIAEKHMFKDKSGLECIGVDSFSHMLSQSGSLTVSKEWVANHYRWIVWKLACYERCYSAKFFGKLLTASNVFEELKYRYEREFNHGHRSALKRILEGDAPPSSPLVLCVSSIQAKCNAEPDAEALSKSDTADSGVAASIELTDGWYSVNGLLDELLSKQLAAGKLFVGQKLRICGAGLCGWNGPVSPLEASRMISFRLHINGTYRAHWADRLGFCKSGCAPLAFRCIKGSGGVVPSTLIGVTRIYPVLYRERLNDGGFVVRSEKMECKMMQLYDERRSSIAEGIMSDFQREFKSCQFDDEQNSGDEGQKISQMLEKSAEPEIVMSEMSSRQLTSFATYQAKIEATRQSEMEKSIQKALEEAGLSKREVDMLMRVRVVGLASKANFQECYLQRGLITIWNPTEKQQSELVEGQAYAIAGLTPISSDSDNIYLYARGSTTRWRLLSPYTIEHFQGLKPLHNKCRECLIQSIARILFRPFFCPRKPVSLSKMGEVPLSSEFDVAAFVIHVGEVYKYAHQKKQWVFVTDGSVSMLHADEQAVALLAISFCSPSIDSDSIVPINFNLVGSTVGFYNLIKKSKDQMNDMWVAEATENSTYSLSYDQANSLHLKDAAACAQRWAKDSSSKIERLKEKMLSIVARIPNR